MTLTTESVHEELKRLREENAELREALKDADRALWIHHFQPRGHETIGDRDSCAQCGHNFRHDGHLRIGEGHPADVKTTASRKARALLNRKG